MKKSSRKYLTGTVIFILSLSLFFFGDIIDHTECIYAAERYIQHDYDGLMNIPDGLHENHSFVVTDAHTGSIIMGENVDNIVYPASTTKLMTAMVVLDNSDSEDIVTVTDDMLKYIPSDLMIYGMKSGEKYTMETLLNMMLISSSGDAAICAAIGACGSMDAFLSAVNAKCDSLGLVYTHFDNPAGLDIGNDFLDNYTTAYEMAVITRYAMSYPEIRESVAKKKYRVRQADGKKGKRITSSNLFYGKIEYPKEQYKIIGAKTGSTKAAGHVFSAVAKDYSGHEIICVYNGKGPMTETFEDIEKIVTSVFSAIKNKSVRAGNRKAAFVLPVKEFCFKGSYGQKFSLRAEFADITTGKIISDTMLFKISYSSSDSSVAYVDTNGVVTVLNPGNADITVSFGGNDYYRPLERVINICIE